MMRTLRTRQQFIAAADEMDRKHPPSYRSEHGQFHRMRRGRAVMAKAWTQWEESEKTSKNGGGRRPRGGAVAQVAADDVGCGHMQETAAVNRIVGNICTTCLQVATGPHGDCVVKCIFCRGEGHRAGDCPKAAQLAAGQVAGAGKPAVTKPAAAAGPPKGGRGGWRGGRQTKAVGRPAAPPMAAPVQASAPAPASAWGPPTTEPAAWNATGAVETSLAINARPRRIR